MGYSLNYRSSLTLLTALAALFGLSMLSFGQHAHQAGEHGSMPGMHHGSGHGSGHGKSTSSAGVTGLDVYVQNGVIHLLLGEDASDQPTALYYRRSADGGATWTEPVRVNQGSPAVYSRRNMDPQIAAWGDYVVAVWTSRNANRFGRGPLVTAVSSDGGRTWHPGPNPADDGSDADHGMSDIAADEQGIFYLAWLDSRKGQKGLIVARSEDHGASWSANQSLVAQTCECCWNSIATKPDGTVAVLYRQLIRGNVRDMGLIQSSDHGHSWAAPVTVGDFNWQIDGCAHCGGGLVFTHGADGRAVCHAAVWTGARPGVFVLSLSDGGDQWQPPVQLGDDSAFHPDLAVDPQGRLAAVWEGSVGPHAAIFASYCDDGGRTWSVPVRLSDRQASAVTPRIVWADGAFQVFWTQRAGQEPWTWQAVSLQR